MIKCRSTLRTVAILTSAVVAGTGAVAEGAGFMEQRPFHIGYVNLNRVYNQEKPLALLDGAGFVVNSGYFVGAFDERWVGALSLATHKVQWWYDGVTTMTAPPGSFGSAVVVGFRDGRIARLDVLTGKPQWAVNLDSFTERSFLLNGTTLYVLTASQVLYALDFQSGKTLWLFDAGFPEGLSIRGGARPIFHDGKVIFGVASGELLAVGAEGGKLVWRYNPAYNDARFHDVVGELAVRNNRLIVSRYDGLVAAIELGDSVRNVVWQERLPGLVTSVFRGSRLFAGGLDGAVYALDVDSEGRRLWRTVTGVPVTALAAGETTLYASGAGGRVTALDGAEGTILWHDRLGSSLASLPIIADDALYYTTGQKSLYAYKLK